jgi:hypothetical protein
MTPGGADRRLFAHRRLLGAYFRRANAGGAPKLYISRSGNTATVYWQDVAGWSLEQNNNLTTPAGWSVNSSWTTANGTNSLSIMPPTGNLFFRLSNP